jgi:hypothetical protein
MHPSLLQCLYSVPSWCSMQSVQCPLAFNSGRAIDAYGDGCSELFGMAHLTIDDRRTHPREATQIRGR